MYNAGKIIPGLVLFLALATAPIWYNVSKGHGAVAPEIEKPQGETQCVADTAFMRRGHMQLLSSWRDEVVRSNDRVYVTADGRRYDKSLTRTCLGCHQSKARSCDRCHDYLDVKPYCWQCHVDPKGGL
jgi:hypothetical protein